MSFVRKLIVELVNYFKLHCLQSNNLFSTGVLGSVLTTKVK